MQQAQQAQQAQQQYQHLRQEQSGGYAAAQRQRGQPASQNYGGTSNNGSVLGGILMFIIFWIIIGVIAVILDAIFK